MKREQLITRRKALITGMASLGALLLPGCSKTSPPTYGNILRMGDAFTYNAHRVLIPGQALVKEYDLRDISSFPATGTVNPADNKHGHGNEEYDKLQKGDFANWRLVVEGRVAQPGSYSLSDLKTFPARTQITRHNCEEGWSAIAQWTGVPLGTLLQSVGIMQTARFVNFESYDGWIDSIDLVDAFHPQTLIAYGMNGKNLMIRHGAPVRLRVETQIGYKSMKYIKRIFVTDEYVDIGDIGWAWYTGI